MKFDDLGIGDEVVLHETAVLRRIATVVRLTQTMIMVLPGNVGPERRFNRRTGCEVGVTGWNIPVIATATAEERNAVRLETKRRRLIRSLEATQWRDRSTEVLEQVVALIKEDLNHA